jgi:hypothetical protein
MIITGHITLKDAIPRRHRQGEGSICLIKFQSSYREVNAVQFNLLPFNVLD